MKKKEKFYGYSGALNGRELWVNFGMKGMARIDFPNEKVAEDFYCKQLEITVEIVGEKVAIPKPRRVVSKKKGKQS